MRNAADGLFPGPSPTYQPRDTYFRYPAFLFRHGRVFTRGRVSVYLLCRNGRPKKIAWMQGQQHFISMQDLCSAGVHETARPAPRPGSASTATAARRPSCRRASTFATTTARARMMRGTSGTLVSTSYLGTYLPVSGLSIYRLSPGTLPIHPRLTTLPQTTPTTSLSPSPRAMSSS